MRNRMSAISARKLATEKVWVRYCKFVTTEIKSTAFSSVVTQKLWEWLTHFRWLRFGWHHFFGYFWDLMEKNCKIHLGHLALNTRTSIILYSQMRLTILIKEIHLLTEKLTDIHHCWHGSYNPTFGAYFCFFIRNCDFAQSQKGKKQTNNKQNNISNKANSCFWKTFICRFWYLLCCFNVTYFAKNSHEIKYYNLQIAMGVDIMVI